jgi:hypothetical protein
MPPVRQLRLTPRSSESDSHYGIIFAVLGSVIVIGGIAWGFFLPRWRKTHRTPVQTRYNSIGRTSKPKTPPGNELELPIIFPPHPAVVVPFDKQPTSIVQLQVRVPNSIPVYDPRTHSPFPNTPRPESTRLLMSHKSMKDKTAISGSTPMNLHSDRLQRSQSYNPANLKHGDASPNTWNLLKGNAEAGVTEANKMKHGKRSLLVPRSAGAPPPKPDVAQSGPEKSRYKIPSRKEHSMIPPVKNSVANASNYKGRPGWKAGEDVDSTICPRPAGFADGILKEKASKNMQKPVRTPGQAGLGFHNIFETPSSLGTATSARFWSSANRAHNEYTPPTGPNSSAIRPVINVDCYPGISKLVPSRRFKDSIATTKEDPCRDTSSEAISRVSSEDTHGSGNILRSNHRPLSGIVTESFRIAQR